MDMSSSCNFDKWMMALLQLHAIVLQVGFLRHCFRSQKNNLDNRFQGPFLQIHYDIQYIGLNLIANLDILTFDAYISYDSLNPAGRPNSRCLTHY